MKVPAGKWTVEPIGALSICDWSSAVDVPGDRRPPRGGTAPPFERGSAGVAPAGGSIDRTRVSANAVVTIAANRVARRPTRSTCMVSTHRGTGRAFPFMRVSWLALAKRPAAGVRPPPRSIVTTEIILRKGRWGRKMYVIYGGPRDLRVGS